MSILHRLRECVGFQWDAGNSEKSWVKHGVSRAEAEEAFDHVPLLLSKDETHSGTEERFHAMGHTDRGRRLFITFTVSREIGPSDLGASDGR
jgi:uncharacterized protein